MNNLSLLAQFLAIFCLTFWNIHRPPKNRGWISNTSSTIPPLATPHVLMPGFVPDGIAWLIECGRKVDVTDNEAQPRAEEVLNL